MGIIVYIGMSHTMKICEWIIQRQLGEETRRSGVTSVSGNTDAIFAVRKPMKNIGRNRKDISTESA